MIVWAFLLSLAFYPGFLGFIAWGALVRPLIILSRLKGKEAFKAAYFYAFFFNFFTLYWISLVTPPGTLVTILIVSLYYSIIFIIFNQLFHIKPLFAFLALPCLWTGIEYFRTLSEFAFPWSDLGYTQVYYPYILQIVSVISVHGLTFLIVIVNVLIWQIFRTSLADARRLTAFFVSIALVVLVIVYGWIVYPPVPLPGKVGISILQGSIPVEKKWEDGNADYSFNLYDSLSRSVADSSIRLFIWPETAAPSYLSHSLRDRATISTTAKATNAYHLVGSLGAKRDGENYKHYNSCYLFKPDGEFGPRYDKIKLVPFTEQVPYQDKLPFLRREFLKDYLTFIETYDVQWWSDFRPGDSIVLFNIDEYLCGVLICYEAAFPEFARQMILDGSDFLVGITNDTWFGHSLGIYMHASYFITRAVENRVWMARAANSGLSYIVDPYGRIRHELPLDSVSALVGKVRIIDGFSIFTRYGDLAGKFSLLITTLLVGIFLIIWMIRKLKISRPVS